MNRSTFHQFDSLPPDRMLEVNRYCDQFEKLWNDSRSASLSDFVQTVDCTDKKTRETLIEELVTLDIQYRRKYGMPVDRNVYERDYPSLPSYIVENLANCTIANLIEVIQFEPGQQLGDYVVEALAGRGGMGQVYRARHSLMARQVAIKLLQQNNYQDPISQKRFEREVQSLASLSHPNIVTAFDARNIDGNLCLVTEWVEGATLSDTVKSRGPLPAPEVIEIGIQAAQGLLYAHNAGVIHRDVKPSNLLIDVNRQVKILDVGIARLCAEKENASTEEQLTQSHHLMGTAEFLAPEQARSPHRAGAASDIYSLGCTLFYLLSGQTAYAGDSPIDIIFKHANSPTPVLSELSLMPSIPTQLSKLVQRMMDKNPDCRPASMAEVVEVLSELREPGGTTSSAAENLRRQLPFGLLSLTAAGVGIVLFGWWIATSVIQSGSAAAQRPRALGVRFDGLTSYATVQNFDIPVDGTAMIEAVVTPRDGPWPANIVTWTGSDSLVLFTYNSQRWGAASLHDGESQLVVSNQKIGIDKTTIVAARRRGSDITLWLDGQPVTTRPLEYQIQSSTTALCFGGIPHGLFPNRDSERFFTGDIHRIRLSASPLPNPASTPEEMSREKSTVALFEFLEAAGDSTTDSTQFQWIAELVNADWID